MLTEQEQYYVCRAIQIIREQGESLVSSLNQYMKQACPSLNISIDNNQIQIRTDRGVASYNK